MPSFPLEVLASVCAGVFAGAAVYISLVQHPAVVRAGRPAAAAYFPAMYRRAAPMQAGLAIAGTLTGLGAWLSGSGPGWLAGALLLGSVVPWTLLVIRPVNDRLLDPGLDPEDPELPDLLRRWGRLHGVRSAASLTALLLFVSG